MSYQDIGTYSGCITTISNLRRHAKDDRLQCTEVDGRNVVVDDTVKIGDRMVYFPVGGQLDEAFANENHLLRGDVIGNQAGYHLHPGRRNITAAIIRDELSEGIALPIEVLGKYTDIQSLEDGDRIGTLNGHQLCRMYIPKEMDIEGKVLRRCIRGMDSKPRVYIPWGIEIIADGAFMHSRRIEEVIIPETVVTIGERAFYDCPALENVVIPDSVKQIGGEAFAYCPHLEPSILPAEFIERADDIFIADDFEIVDGVLVKYHGAQRDVVIPEGLTEIGYVSFSHNDDIETVVIPDGVEKIASNAFAGCRRLRKVSIPEGLFYIGDKAFFACKSLHEVRLPLGVEFIGAHAFGEYYSFRYVEGFKHPVDEYKKYDNFRLYYTE